MKKLLSILMLLVAIVTGAKAEEFTITPSLNKDHAILGYGLVTIAKAGTVGNCKFGSGKVQSNSNGDTFSFTVATTYAGVTIKSITFSSIEKKSSFTCTAGGSLNAAGTEFTPSGDKNTATFEFVPESGKTGKLAMSIVLDGGENDIETISTFTGKTDNKFAFTTKKNGTTVDNDVTISSADATASSNNISWTNGKAITISASENIKFVGFFVADGDFNKSGVTSNEPTYSNTAWSGSAKSISFTQSTGGGRALSTIYLIKEAGVSCTISFDKGEGEGIAPADIVKNAGNDITLPKNFTMYKEGFTMTGWDADGNGTADYAPGAEYTVSGDATLKAVFEPNDGTTLADRTGATAITFDFQRKNGAPTVTWESPSLPTSGVWIAQANVAGKTIDVKMDWDVSTAGKINNSSWSDWSQLNDGTQLVIPSAAGATVDIEAFNNEDEETTVNGDVRTSVSGNTSHYEISSSDPTATIVMSGKGAYYRTIKVTLPGPTYGVDFTLSNVTKTSGEATVEGGTEYIATFAADKGYGFPASVTVTAGGSDISANCTWSSGTLTIPAAYTTDDIAITVNGVVIAGSEIIRATITAANTATPSGTLYKSTTTNLSGHDSGKSGWKFSGNGSYVLLTLADGQTFKKGDVVNVHITAAPGQGTMAIYSSSNAVLQATGVTGIEGNNNIVLNADVDGQQSIKFLRTNDNNWNAHIDYISVTRGTEEISTTSGNTYATHVTTADLDFTGVEGITAYIATGENGSTITTEAVTKVPAGTPLLIKTAEAGATVNVPIAASTPAALTANKLRFSTASLVITSDDADAKRYYGFFKVGGKYGFAPMAAGTLAAKKAYLEYESNTLHFIALDLEDAPTAINFVEAENNANSAAPIKVIKNGKLYIGNYNVAGQQVK